MGKVDSNKPIDAMVLSGGGAFGAYEVGIMKGLFETGAIDPNVFSGTSVGSWNAVVMCAASPAQAAIRQLESLWMTEIVQNRETGANGVYRVRFNPLELVKFQALENNPAKPWSISPTT
jgi:predicted acylesterase/phospholipase RssA